MTWLILLSIAIVLIILVVIINFTTKKNLVLPPSRKQYLYDPIPVNINYFSRVEDREAIPAKVNAQLIPRTIIQTNQSRDVTGGLALSVENIKRYNPEYQYLYFNDAQCSEFIKNNFSERIYLAFENLIPGAYRSDFFRTCYLYKNGGVYMDTGFICLASLREIISETDVFICPEDNCRSSIEKNNFEGNRFIKNITGPKKYYYLHNAFMASSPQNPILKRHIDIMVDNIETQNYSDDEHSVTGPGALGKAFYQTLNFFDIGKFETEIGKVKILRSVYFGYYNTAFISPEIELENIISNSYFMSKTFTYRHEQKLHSRPYYGSYYKQRKIFGKEEIKETKISEKYTFPVIKKLCHPDIIAMGTVELQDYYPATVKMDYAQIIPKTAFYRIKNKTVTKEIYQRIMTFMRLNPEYEFHMISDDKSINGLELDIKWINLISFREFIDPTAANIDVKNLAKWYNSNILDSKTQTLDVKKSRFSKSKYVTDGKDYGGVSDRILFYV